jgi:hypothetical protein
MVNDLVALVGGAAAQGGSVGIHAAAVKTPKSPGQKPSTSRKKPSAAAPSSGGPKKGKPEADTDFLSLEEENSLKEF